MLTHDPDLDVRAMTADELRQALQMTPSTFYRHQSLGKFERFELRPRIGLRRYSRKLVTAYLNGDYTGRGFTTPRKQSA